MSYPTELRFNGVRRSSLLGSLRARTNRSWAAGGKGLPAIAGPGFSNEPSHDDDRVGKGHPEVDDSPFPLGAPHKLLMGIATRIGSFYDPPFRGSQRSRLTLLGDSPLRTSLVLW